MFILNRIITFELGCSVVRPWHLRDEFHHDHFLGKTTIATPNITHRLFKNILIYISLLEGQKVSKNNLIENKIRELNKTIDIFYFEYKPIDIKNYLDKSVISFAGIGNPEGFFELLRKNNINILNNFSFPDHHNYTDHEIKKLINEAKENDAILLTTEKDFLRIKKEFHDKLSFLKIELIIEKKNELMDKIKKIT